MVSQKAPIKITTKIKRRTLSIVIVSLISPFLILHSPFLKSASAHTISNPNYSIDVDTIDTNPQPTPKTPKEVLGSMTQNLKDAYTSGQNYTVTNSNDSLALSVSQDAIDLGILSGTNPVIRTSQISIKNPGQVLTYENHPLQAQDNVTIPDTSCDNGTCTEMTSAPWLSTLTYGFGYRCDSDQMTCDNQFKASNTYKQYPDNAKNEAAQAVITNYLPNKSISTMVTYKVTISATQKQEGYYNSITYLAVPNF